MEGQVCIDRRVVLEINWVEHLVWGQGQPSIPRRCCVVSRLLM